MIKLAVPGLSGYLVDDGGTVWSQQPGRYRRWAGQVHALRSHTDARGYQSVVLHTPNGKRRHAVHQLVAPAFHGALPSGREVGHLDGNPRNNAPCNLAYVTPGENTAHRWQHGTMTCGEQSHLSRLADEDVRDMWKAIQDGAVCSEIRSRYGVSEPYFYALKAGRIRKHITGLGLSH